MENIKAVHNVPDYVEEYDYMVVRLDDYNEGWFYGAYKTAERAWDVAEQIDGIVMYTR